MSQVIVILVLLGLLAWTGWRALGKTPSALTALRENIQRLYASQTPYLRVVAGFAAILVPIWLLLLFGVIWSISTLFLAERPPSDDPVAIRLHYLGIGSMVLAILALVGAPLGLIRVWTSERQTKVAESNLTTDLINKAVEGLGADKTVSRIGRPVKGLDQTRPEVTEIQWEGDALPDGAEPTGDWRSFDRTAANLEVRIGAILTLERIARENPEEHVRVMEIICAYIRENAPARGARLNPLDNFPDYPDPPSAEDLTNRAEMRRERKRALSNWGATLRRDHAPRTDIQTALEAIGRRTEEQIAREGARDANGDWIGYRLDLREANLQAADLQHRRDRAMRFRNARLGRARMEGADLRGARMEGAALSEARMEGAVLHGARMEGVDLDRARMERVDLSGARLDGAVLWWARMEGAVLWRARMVGVDLDGARMEGATLGGADVRSAEWTGAHVGSPVHSADLRGAKGLTQAQLDRMIGDARTLLPETLQDGSVPSIPACWPAPGPDFFEAFAKGLRAGYLCPEGAEPARTGTPLALDAPYPEGHPLAERGD